MKIVFTICSNNYLAQAKSLGDSIKKNNPEYQFYIGLTDRINDKIDYDKEIAYPIILSEEIGIPDFDDLWRKYTIIEFNTCVKPFFFQYFISLYPDLEYLFYLDPDTFLFNSLKHIEIEFGNDSNVLLTPHILTPIKLDGYKPNEHLFLNFGIYNLGFIGLKYPSISKTFIDWWKERTYHLGFNLTAEGLFVDQLWINLVPIFFQNVKVSKHLGINMAPWNLHERNLSKINEEFIINQTTPLIFFHFSKFKYLEPEIIGEDYNRYNYYERNDLTEINKIYKISLMKNGFEKLRRLDCEYMLLRKKYFDNLNNKRKNLFYYFKRIIEEIMPPFLSKKLVKL